MLFGPRTDWLNFSTKHAYFGLGGAVYPLKYTKPKGGCIGQAQIEAKVHYYVTILEHKVSRA